MNDAKTTFTLTVNIKRNNEDPGHIFYKQDGQRFGYNCTIKLNVETHYTFTLTFKPGFYVDSASLKGSTVSLSQETSKDPDVAIYTFDWFTTGVCISKKNFRDELPLVLNIRDMGALTVMFQAKFYKAGDENHSTWGNALHHANFDCETKPFHSFIDIIKEVYR